jgi:hypothetical protein
MAQKMSLIKHNGMKHMSLGEIQMRLKMNSKRGLEKGKLLKDIFFPFMNL